jgi:hypothetical protein
MMDPLERCLVVEGPEEAIDEIAQVKAEGLRCSPTRDLDGGANVLDAPLTPDQVVEVLKTISLLITTSSAGLVLFEKIIALKQKLAANKIVVRDLQSGEIKGAITADTSEEEVRRFLGQ